MLLQVPGKGVPGLLSSLVIVLEYLSCVYTLKEVLMATFRSLQ